jgi:hypothetical protein
MLCGGGIDAHAADRIDRRHGGGFFCVIVLAATAAMNRRRGAMVILMVLAGMNRVHAMCLIVRHQKLSRALNYIP